MAQKHARTSCSSLLPCQAADSAVLQFSTHAAPRAMLLATASATQDALSVPDVVEAAPHDFFWGRGIDGSGSNHLGALLMRLRASLLNPSRTAEAPVEQPMVWDTMPAGC